MQEAYEKQCRDVFEALQAMDDRLASRRYLIDNYIDGAPSSCGTHQEGCGRAWTHVTDLPYLASPGKVASRGERRLKLQRVSGMRSRSLHQQNRCSWMRLGGPRVLVMDAFNTYCTGYAEPTLADWRLYATLVRFDAVYYARMKVNLRYVRQFPHLQARPPQNTAETQWCGSPTFSGSCQAAVGAGRSLMTLRSAP